MQSRPVQSEQIESAGPSESVETDVLGGEAHPHVHADVSGGWLRAAVFGAMDGLVTNISLIAGVGGGGLSPRQIVLTGTAGLVAGALSMAIGEYTSVKTQNEQLDHEIEKERHELLHNAESEEDELAEMYVARGLSPALAAEVAAQLSKDPEQALRIHVQEELGLDLDERPSPRTAAVSSFICFSIGALLPLLPYLLGFPVLWVALLAGAAGLFAAGAAVARFTTRTWWGNGSRQLALGLVAAVLTYLVGRAFGAVVG
ncbi:MAG TPA: VIT1/CCC1 transporter family protein [Mycobacteriales bacterium]|nr:VIT1/CCC1 transporter family protein [Mycobacteriales bacterium]